MEILLEAAVIFLPERVRHRKGSGRGKAAEQKAIELGKRDRTGKIKSGKKK